MSSGQNTCGLHIVDKKRKVVLDTNALLQILGRFSKYHVLWDKFVNDEFVLCCSNEILCEYEEILKEQASSRMSSLFFDVIEFSENVIRKDPFFKLNLIKRDPDDNKFVDCAFACQAECIVTDDSHFDDLKQVDFPQIVVISLNQFLDEMQ